MSDINTVTITGTVLSVDGAPQLTKTGTPVANLILQSVYNAPKGDYSTRTNVWVTMWGELAKNTLLTVQEGDQILVIGYLTENKWTTKEGVRRNELRVTATNVGPSTRNVIWTPDESTSSET